MIKKMLFGVFIVGAYFFSTLTFNRCAQIVQPVGGLKDTIPPQIVAKYSTPNYQKNFTPKRIELTFNEWIKLEDPNNQVVVSPPLTDRPIVTLDGKKVIVEFSKTEVLKTNATYTVQFGNAVKDLSEGNAAPKLKFVFATGNELDSLIFSAKVVDVLTQLPVENALVMLYDALTDSVVHKQKPFYFGRTDKSGLAVIENVRGGKFKVFALLEKDNNYLYNAEGEKIAFQDSLVTVNSRDTVSANALVLKMFEPQKKMQLLSKETDAYGLVRLGYSTAPNSANVNTDKIFDRHSFTEIARDSILFWYDIDSDINNSTLIVNQKIDTFNLSDTVKFKIKGRADFLKRQKLLTITPNVLDKVPSKPITLNFNHPIIKFDSTLIVLKDSSGKRLTDSIAFDVAHPREINIYTALPEGKFKLTVLPNALKSIYGIYNDSLKFSVSVNPEKDYGEIELAIKNLDSLVHYQIQLTSGEGLVVANYSASKTTTFSKTVSYLKPDTYKLSIIEDDNQNKKWDSGDYFKHLQPEKIYSKVLQTLRQDWKLLAEVDLQAL